jgi:hypothetical protein
MSQHNIGLEAIKPGFRVSILKYIFIGAGKV